MKGFSELSGLGFLGRLGLGNYGQRGDPRGRDLLPWLTHHPTPQSHLWQVCSCVHVFTGPVLCLCRYIPCVGDNVIGVVIERHSDNLILDIGGPFPAVLNSLAFEGATRRNRPKLGEGDLVYARVTLAHKDVDTELSCTEVSGKVRSKIAGM